MGGEDSAHIAQGGGSRGSSHEKPRIAGGLRGSACGYLYVSPRPAGVGCQDRLCDCDIQSSRTTYEWNPDVRPSLYDLVIRLEGGIHETSNAFWSYENTYTMQPLYKVNKRYDALTREYLSSIYVDELDSPALSERSRAKLPHMNLQTTEHAEQHT